MNELEGKSVVITGAGSGVGRASALRFASAGARVVCADLRAEWGTETAKLVEAQGGTALAVPCDVTDSDQVEGAVAAAIDAFGRLDVMFNNAGVMPLRRPTLVDDHSDEELDRILAVNSRGVFFGCRVAASHFKRQGGGGAIVSTASIAGLVGLGSAAYAGSKGFVISLTRALAIELADENIRVNCICPGGMFTNLTLPEGDAWRERRPEEVEIISGMHPLGRPVEPEDIAEAALYLASDRAKNVTGIALPVDGGFVAR